MKGILFPGISLENSIVGHDEFWDQLDIRGRHLALL